MRKIVIACALIALPTTVLSQQVMDGSDENFINVPDVLVKGLIGQVPDPYSAQIINIRKSVRSPDDICGLVNLKGQTAGYTGFRPFMISSGHVLIEGVISCQ